MEQDQKAAHRQDQPAAAQVHFYPLRYALHPESLPTQKIVLPATSYWRGPLSTAYDYQICPLQAGWLYVYQPASAGKLQQKCYRVIDQQLIAWDVEQQQAQAPACQLLSFPSTQPLWLGYYRHPLNDNTWQRLSELAFRERWLRKITPDTLQMLQQAAQQQQPIKKVHHIAPFRDLKSLPTLAEHCSQVPVYDALAGDKGINNQFVGEQALGEQDREEPLVGEQACYGIVLDDMQSDLNQLLQTLAQHTPPPTAQQQAGQQLNMIAMLTRQLTTVNLRACPAPRWQGLADFQYWHLRQAVTEFVTAQQQLNALSSKSVSSQQRQQAEQAAQDLRQRLKHQYQLDLSSREEAQLLADFHPELQPAIRSQARDNHMAQQHKQQQQAQRQRGKLLQNCLQVLDQIGPEAMAFGYDVQDADHQAQLLRWSQWAVTILLAAPVLPAQQSQLQRSFNQQPARHLLALALVGFSQAHQQAFKQLSQQMQLPNVSRQADPWHASQAIIEHMRETLEACSFWQADLTTSDWFQGLAADVQTSLLAMQQAIAEQRQGQWLRLFDSLWPLQWQASGRMSHQLLPLLQLRWALPQVPLRITEDCGSRWQQCLTRLKQPAVTKQAPVGSQAYLVAQAQQSAQLKALMQQQLPQLIAVQQSERQGEQTPTAAQWLQRYWQVLSEKAPAQPMQALAPVTASVQAFLNQWHYQLLLSGLTPIMHHPQLSTEICAQWQQILQEIGLMLALSSGQLMFPLFDSQPAALEDAEQAAIERATAQLARGKQSLRTVSVMTDIYNHWAQQASAPSSPLSRLAPANYRLYQPNLSAFIPQITPALLMPNLYQQASVLRALRIALPRTEQTFVLANWLSCKLEDRPIQKGICHALVKWLLDCPWGQQPQDRPAEEQPLLQSLQQLQQLLLQPQVDFRHTESGEYRFQGLQKEAIMHWQFSLCCPPEIDLAHTQLQISQQINNGLFFGKGTSKQVSPDQGHWQRQADGWHRYQICITGDESLTLAVGIYGQLAQLQQSSAVSYQTSNQPPIRIRQQQAPRQQPAREPA